MTELIGICAYLLIGFVAATGCAAYFGKSLSGGDGGFLIFPLLLWPACVALGALFGLGFAALRLGYWLRKRLGHG